MARRQRESQMPEVNLVPMMDVLMTVLTFFIIISMTLSGQQVLNILLPGVGEENEAVETFENNVPLLVVGLDEQEQIIIRNEVVTVQELAEAMRVHLTENEEGIILLKADRSLDYSQVSGLLRTMRDIGGDRVSLGIGSSDAE
ncbi:ExbD/TolR family protein [Vacuolonema iberomarrocanum]|uniref:ExbD/TolR family protein n=1 Tax=Vacuolonema iberomarrocanum TaxID=3454632 RepID=UPI0019E7C539|nr:biopolymer transporter ExbD [filamentous cyanobacterium LEGE 07170]